jgi:hypothetical protein
VENNQPLQESLKALSARALGEGPKTLGVAHSGNKYSLEAASPSVKLRVPNNCFQVLYLTLGEHCRKNKKHFAECY